ncbi:hypothetical protein [Butyrivibrio sp. AE3004]|uniref:hypothetical protein n=1 Tax=Butyrivibrio sp. AE3004 TaxID=1506994 RepID=UPI0004944858|nr:hypothetical protein [Butyrivibrio sp. AE3004]
MKLKKTWIGICVGVMYVLGMIFAIGVTGFVSGLLPSYNRYLVAGVGIAACAIASLVISWILSIIGDKINDIENVNNFRRPIWLEIVIVIALIITGIFTYSRYAMLVTEFSGNISLYDSAIVVQNTQNVQTFGIADSLYVGLLRSVISFLGNTLGAALLLNIALRIAMAVFVYIAVRLSMGMASAIIAGGLLLAIPAFGYSTREIGSDQLILTAFAFELLLAVIYVKGFEKSIGNHIVYKIISVIFGALTGAMIYFEAGSAVVIVFALSAWMLADMCGDTFNVCINEILALFSGVAAFIGMLALEGGIDRIYDTYHAWTWRFYGFNDSSWIKMINDSIPNTYFAVGLLAAALLPAWLTLIRDRCERIVPWLAFSVIGIVLSLFLGETVMNSEVFIITAIVLLISCGISCAAYNDIAKDITEESKEVAEKDEVSSKDPIGKDEDESKAKTKNETEALDKSLTTDETSEKNEIGEDLVSEETEKKDEEKKTPRFVPEGMVLPTGDEDEEDLVPNFNMKRQEMSDIGVLSIGPAKKKQENEVQEDSKNPEEPDAKSTSEDKDDFDIITGPGDDFDI